MMILPLPSRCMREPTFHKDAWMALLVRTMRLHRLVIPIKAKSLGRNMTLRRERSRGAGQSEWSPKAGTVPWIPPAASGKQHYRQSVETYMNEALNKAGV